MKAELERLRQAQARLPVPVSEWKVTGKVVGARAELKVRLTFVTPIDGATVVLGCRQGHPNAVTLDGEVAAINPAVEGLALEVEKKGRHEAVVDLMVPLREVALSDRPRPPLPLAVHGDALLGFELDLPLSAVTLVEIDLPEGARTVEVNDQPLREPLTLDKNELSGPLGKVNRLKVGWKGPGEAASTQAPLLDAHSRVTVRLVKKEVHTEAELTLQDMTRTVKEWQLRLPEQATVRLGNPKDQALLDGPIQGSGSRDGKVTIALKAPVAGPLVVVVNSQQQRGNGAVPLGPFTVLRAGRQRGTVWVVGEADQRDQRAGVELAGRGQPLPWLTLTPRELDERDETGPPPAGAVASYQFWTTAAVEASDPRSAIRGSSSTFAPSRASSTSASSTRCASPRRTARAGRC